MKRFFLIVILLEVLCHVSFSQNKYAVSLIPDSLKYRANAVIRSSEVDIRMIDSETALYHCKLVTTILNEGGIEFAYLNIPYKEGHSEIKYISGTIYDQFGNEIYTIKKDDVKDHSYYDGFSLYTDIRYKVIKEPLMKPPYTIDYEYEIKLNSILSYPSFKPVDDFKISSERSVLRITEMSNTFFRSMPINDEGNIFYEFNTAGQAHTWTLNSFKAIEEEPYSSSVKQFPGLLIAPNDFVFEGYAGNSESWSSFGKWIESLIIGRNDLSEETIQEVKRLVNDEMSVYEKAKHIYLFMQQRTRYVNIALGIGGWQPNKTADTDRNGYGDCKALSLYMKTLLEAVGIKSYYALIKAGSNNDEFFGNFPSNQFNHVILCLPINSDTLWLECTDQDQPFGYLGKFTDDRDALIIDSDGNSKLSHTTVYPEDVNNQIRKGEIIVDESGKIYGVTKTVYSGLQYDNFSYLLNKSYDENAKELNKIMSIPNMQLKSFTHEAFKERIPSLIQTIDFSAIGYASLSSGRLFLVPNIFNRIDKMPAKLDRRQSDIVFRRGYTTVDTIHFRIPEGFAVEYLPENISEITLFGSFEVSYQIENSSLIYTRKHIIHKGIYPPSEYENLRKFMKTLYESDKKTIVFKKI
jgi:hypothetical protein